jgi:PBSX family phage portal protein
MKAKVFIADGKGNSLEELFGLQENQNVSKQLLEDPFNYNEDNTVQPPYSIESFCTIFETSSMVHSCIVAYQQNVLGFGWDVVFAEDVDPEDEEAKAQQKILDALLNDPNPEITSGQILFNQYMTDKETCGDGYIEIVRNLKGEIIGLWNAATRTIRIRGKKFDPSLQRKTSRGYVQYVDLKKMFFKNFGDERGLNRHTGEYYAERLPRNQEANELLHNRIYAPRSPYYGIPRYVSAGMAITGMYWAERTDNSYFKNGCFIGKMMVITNAKLDQDSMAEMNSYISALKGNPDNAHKMMVISLEAENDEESASLSTKEKKADVKFESMSDKNELGFKDYYESSEKIIKRGFRLPDIFLGENKEISRANYWTARAFAEEQIFQPLRKEEEEFFNQTLVKKFNLYDESVLSKVRIKFKSLPTGDSKEQAEEDRFASMAGSRTTNEMRERDGKTKIEAWWADVPQGIAKTLLSAGFPPNGSLEDMLKIVEQQGKSVVIFNKDATGKDRFVQVQGVKELVEGIVTLRNSLQNQIDSKTGG